MKISIIIPTYNEEKVLVDCIKSLGNQTYKDFEIIVVDDGSTDGTIKVLSELKTNNLKLKTIQSSHLGAGAARNMGAKHAEGDILVFVDADMTFDKAFLVNLTKSIVSPPPQGYGEVKGTFSKEEYVSNWENPWARCWNINEGWEEKRRHPKNYPDQQPVFRAILKSEFDRVGGFTPGGYDDDWSLAKKLGYEAVFAPEAIFYHKNPSSLSEVYRHAKWVGKRKYKMGVVGYFIALFRAILPFSIVAGISKGVINKNLRFIIFKIVYDFGTSLGILEYMLSGVGAK
jgi:glycosyltransferase involved in cell wall biosynthesis